jgi:tetratricopeptide (TPR) repeat protein
VGFGTPDGDFVPVSGGDPLEDARGETVRSRRTDALLERIAQGTDGVYLREREDNPQPRDLLFPARTTARTPAVKAVRSDGLLLLAAVLLGTEILLSTRRRKGSSWSYLRGTALAALTGLGLSCGSGDWITAGDRLLEAQEARKALSMYRKAERKAGAGPLTSIRIGNAHYRLDEDRRSAGAYLEALRGVDAEDHSARFVASFNLGNTFLRRSLYAEARDAFWAALRERPENLAAKFNYEWAYQHAQTEVVPPSPSGSARPPESRAQSDSPPGSSAPGATAREPAAARRAGLEPAEAQRWLESLEETLAEPLRREIERSLPPGRHGPRQGQTW